MAVAALRRALNPPLGAAVAITAWPVPAFAPSLGSGLGSHSAIVRSKHLECQQGLMPVGFALVQ